MAKGRRFAPSKEKEGNWVSDFTSRENNHRPLSEGHKSAPQVLNQTPVVQGVDSVFHWINHYLVHNVVVLFHSFIG